MDVQNSMGNGESMSEATEPPVEPAAPAPATFEGEFISEMEGRLPAFTIDMPEGYTRGTHLRFNVEVRVKNVRYDETRRGDLIRQHIFAIEEVALVSAFSPEQDNTGVGGSASAQSVPTPDEQAEMGVHVGRTSDHWGQVISVDKVTGEIETDHPEVPAGWEETVSPVEEPVVDPAVGF